MASLPLPALSNPHFSHFKSTHTRKSLNLAKTHILNLHESEKTSQIPYKSYFHNISSLCKECRIHEAFAALTEMESENLPIGPEIYGELLQGCVYERALFTGQQIHSRLIKNGDFFSKNEYIETKLVVFYAKCLLSDFATDLFLRARKQNVFCWAAIIGLHCGVGSYQEAIFGFCQMLHNGVSPDNFVVPNALKACSALQLIGFGKGVHGYVLKMGLDYCVFVESSLIDMYGKCGVLEDARKVFDAMSERNAVAWNSMIVGYVQNGMNGETLKVFNEMRLQGIDPTRVTISSFLTASANLEALIEGRQAHAIAALSGLELDNILGTSLINFYSKVGSFKDAEIIFSRMVQKDVVTWNLLISSYVQDRQVDKALDMCCKMRLENLRFDSVTLTSVLSASVDLRNLELGKAAHCYCIRNNLESDMVVASSIVDMYAKCQRIGDARQVFDTTTQRDMVLWNTLISAYAEVGLIGETLKVFYQMQFEGVPPNLASWNSVILGFLRNGQVDEAKDMFSEMRSTGMLPNLITWTTLISGLAQNGHWNDAILFFQEMQSVGIQPNTVSIICMLSTCTDIVSLRYGRTIHGYIQRHELSSCISIATSLVDMYAKCGSINLAKRVFDTILRKELACYNAMISAYALHGQAAEALALFKKLQEEELEPDGITFTGVLSACSHAGMVDKGLQIFADMLPVYHVMPSIQHYGCVVSLLSQSGSLEEALRLIFAMPFDLDAKILGSLLFACTEHHEHKLGEYFSRRLFELEPDNSGNYVALSNIYATAGYWDKVSTLRDSMKEKGLRKNPGCSWIQIGSEIHVFIAGDGSHPQRKVIYETLAWLDGEIKLMGCTPMGNKAEVPPF
ncbi:pentatricopeptide repeat-containing protein At5g55740, chloroplastic [Macadamia integrifolia]|uniref:pentatricopeptide repeat-containing protein At5g55740, chloroplastic n=1 Tax=Macadamia integrifolia TaxID=60698 RepID=UPI001C4F0870|nr:pentatricopeptide repeat-containing protein At5g55740, chloroplastic [Macadamia integrifolia]